MIIWHSPWQRPLCSSVQGRFGPFLPASCTREQETCSDRTCTRRNSDSITTIQPYIIFPLIIHIPRGIEFDQCGLASIQYLIEICLGCNYRPHNQKHATSGLSTPFQLTTWMDDIYIFISNNCSDQDITHSDHGPQGTCRWDHMPPEKHTTRGILGLDAFLLTRNNVTIK